MEKLSEKKTMLLEIMDGIDFEGASVFGYYGGENFGDELLLEVFMNLMKLRNVRTLSFYYQDPEIYGLYHADFGYNLISPRKGWFSFAKNVFLARSIVVGGGGHWGRDFSMNFFLLILFALFGRIFLRKKIYLLGAGYYSSTGLLGNICAFFSYLSAHKVVVRDSESLKNFSRFGIRKVFLGCDLAFLIPDLDLSIYEDDIFSIEQSMKGSEARRKRILISPRVVEGENAYVGNLLEAIMGSDVRNASFLFLRPFESLIEKTPKLGSVISGSRIHVLDFRYNPIALYLFLVRHRDEYVVFAPQYHAHLVAYLAGVEFIPIYYDNKNLELLKDIGVVPWKRASEVTVEDLKDIIKR